MGTNSVEIRDMENNLYYPKTTAVNVTASDGKSIEVKLTEIASGTWLDFDVLSNSKGYSCATVKSGSNFTETITKTAAGKKAATRTTVAITNGYRETITFYGEDGATVKETRTKTTTKTSTGFSEVVS